jgi:hypothetical protein
MELEGTSDRNALLVAGSESGQASVSMQELFLKAARIIDRVREDEAYAAAIATSGARPTQSVRTIAGG